MVFVCTSLWQLSGSQVLLQLSGKQPDIRLAIGNYGGCFNRYECKSKESILLNKKHILSIVDLTHRESRKKNSLFPKADLLAKNYSNNS